MSSIHIREALPEDAEAIRDVQRRTWIATYPHAAYGITKEDNVVSYNEKAIAFYRAFGFVSTRPVASSETIQLPSGTRLPEITMAKREF